jgi:urease accessory protein
MNRMTLVRRAGFGLALLGGAGAALAHPGHGGDVAAGLLHPFTGLDHLLAMVAVGLWAAVGLPAQRRVWAPLVLVASMVAGAWAAQGQFAPGWIEAMVAASVVGMGVMLAAGNRLPALPGLVLIAMVGALHGAVHGFESTALAPAGYVSGLAGATALLQAIGLVAGAGLRRLGRGALGTAAATIGVAGLAMLVTRL